MEFQGFSIREYAWRRRSVDLVKCWPFSADITGDRVQYLLPPIIVARFRWWSHELAVLREDSRATAEESERPVRRTKNKSRQPKKRSIVEIFAEAPPVDAVRDKDEGDSGGDDCNGTSRDFKRKRKKQKKEITKNKKKKFDDANMAKKVSKHKENQRATFCKNLDGAKCCPVISEETSNLVPLSRKKAALQCVSYIKKGKPLHSTKSFMEVQDQAFQVCSVLKTKKKVCTVDIGSDFKLKNSDNQTSVRREKRVSFSNKSDLLSQRKKKVAFFKPNFCSSKKNAFSLSSTVDHASENGKELPVIFNDHHSDDKHVQNKLQHVVAEGELTHASDSLSSFLRPHLSFQERIKNVMDKPLTPSEPGITSNDFGVADDCVQISTHKLNLGWKTTDYGMDCIRDFAAGNLEGNAEVAPQLRSSIFTLDKILTKGNPFFSQSGVEAMHHQTLQNWASFLGPPVEWKQRAIISRQTYLKDEFVGFPLSLQGEVVSAERARFGGFDQLLFSGSATGSTRSLPAENKLLSKSMVNFSNMNKHETQTALTKDRFPLRNEKRPKYFPARLGVDETFAEIADAMSENSGGYMGQSVHSPNSDLNLKSHSFNVWKKNDLIQNYNSPATMRLMGKDVMVGGSSSGPQFSFAGKGRTNEGIVAQNSSVNTLPLHVDSCLLGSHAQQSCPCPGSLGHLENVLTKTLDSSWNGTLRRDNLKDLVPGFCDAHPAPATWASGDLTPHQSLYPTILKAYRPPARPMFDNYFSFQRSGLTKSNSFIINRQQHFPSIPQIAGPPLGYSSVDFDLNLLAPHAMKQSFAFPSPCLDGTEQSLPPWSHNSFHSSIPWLLSTAQQAKTSLAPQISHEVCGEFVTCATGHDYHANESAHQLFALDNPHDPRNFCSHTGRFSGNATRLSPTLSGIKTPYINFCKGNRINAKGRMESKVNGAQGEVCINKSNKRQVAVDKYSMKNHKIPNLQMLDGLDSMKELASNNMNCERWGNERVYCTQGDSLMDDVRALSGVEFSRNVMQTDIVNLTPGAKHVVKSNQDTSQCNPGLMQSTIPLVSFSDQVSFAEQETKLQIYRI